MEELKELEELEKEEEFLIKGILVVLIVLGVELKLIIPKTAWQILYPLLIDLKKICKELKVKSEEKEGVIFLEDKLSNKIIRKKNWVDDYIYFDKPFSKDEVPGELIEAYLSKNFNLLFEIMSNFLFRLSQIYGIEEISKDYLNFLEKTVKNINIDKKIANLGEKIIETIAEKLEKQKGGS